MLLDTLSKLPEGAIPDKNPEPLVLPVKVYTDPQNAKLLEARLDYNDWIFNKSDATLVILGLQYKSLPNIGPKTRYFSRMWIYGPSWGSIVYPLFYHEVVGMKYIR